MKRVRASEREEKRKTSAGLKWFEAKINNNERAQRASERVLSSLLLLW